MQIGDLVLYKNNQLIALNKPCGLAVQPDKSQDKALLDLAEIYCQSRLKVIHRLDRPASGLVLFAKTQGALVHLNSQFQEREVTKTYLAIVKEAPPEANGHLVHHLIKDGRRNRSKIVDTAEPSSKKAELRYRTLGSSDKYHLLEIELITGRHHQIRAQLAAVGCPIRGDEKYGFRRANRDRSIQLHAWKLGFRHPVSGEKVELTAAPPEENIWAAFAEQIQG